MGKNMWDFGANIKAGLKVLIFSLIALFLNFIARLILVGLGVASESSELLLASLLISIVVSIYINGLVGRMFLGVR